MKFLKIIKIKTIIKLGVLFEQWSLILLLGFTMLTKNVGAVVKLREEIDLTKAKSIYTKDVVLVMAASFFFMFSVMFVTPLINGFALDLGASTVFAGVITGMMSIISMFLRPVAGNLTDHFSKYQLSFIGGILIFIGVGGYCFSSSGIWLLIFRLINGVGFVLATVCMATWLSMLVPRENVGQAMGFYGLMNALAMAVAPAAAINLYKVIGYRWSLALATLAAFLMIILLPFVGNKGKPVVTGRKTQHKKFKIIQLNALPVGILIMLFAFPYFITQADIVMYATYRHLNISVGIFFIIYAIALLIIRTVLKKYFDTVRFGKWFWISVLAMIIFLLAASYMFNDWIMALAALALSVGYGVIYSVLQSTALLLAPMDEQGLATATFYLGMDIAMAFGPMLGGVLAAKIPHSWFYLVLLAEIPLMIIVYLIYRKRLNGAIDHH